MSDKNVNNENFNSSLIFTTDEVIEIVASVVHEVVKAYFDSFKKPGENDEFEI